MSSEAGSGDERLLAILERCLFDEENGIDSDVEALCEGDLALAARVRALLSREPAGLRPASGSGPRSTSTPAPAIERFADFELVERIGGGGMGEVWLARQLSLGRRVALKLLDPAVTRDPRAIARFRREAEVAASLDHPNVVPVYAIGEENGRAFIAMKLLSGPSLAELAAPLGPREIARIGAAIARALDAAHLSGIVHRDVKPANILYDGDTPCIVDFGLARAYGDETLTREGAVPGTLLYMAPELLSGASSGLDPRVDVYSLGASLYELTLGRPPFEASTPEHLATRILFEDVSPLRLRAAERDFATVVERALAKDPRERFQSAAELADELERYLEGRPIRSRRIGPMGRALRLARRHRRASISAGVGLLAILSLIGLLLVGAWRERRDVTNMLSEVDDAMADGELAAAGRVLAPLLERHADDARVQGWKTRIEGELAVEELLRGLLARPYGMRATDLRTRMEAVAGGPGLLARPRVAELALAASAFHLGESEPARERLEAARSAGAVFAASAVENAHEGELEVGAPGPELEVPADEIVVAAAALRLAGAELEQQEEWFSAALEREPGHRHARYGRAIGLLEAGELRDAARALEDLVQREDTPHEVWRSIARAYVRSGNAARARLALAHIRDEDLDVLDAHTELELLHLEGDRATFDRRLEQFLSRWPDASFLVRARGEALAFRDHRFAEGRAELERARDLEEDPAWREYAQALVFHVDVAAVEEEQLLGTEIDASAESSPPEVAEERKYAFEALAFEGEDLLSGLENRNARGYVCWLVGRCWILGGHIGQGADRLEEAINLSPWLRAPYLDLVLTLVQAGLDPERDMRSRWYASSRARRGYDMVRSRIEGGELALDPVNEAHMQEALLNVALLQHDYGLVSPEQVARWMESPRFSAETKVELERFLEEMQSARDGAYGD